MKVIRIENGKLVLYIQRQDVATLVSMKDYVREEIFQEESILKDQCDENGHYRITDIRNVHYIKLLPFIPNYDYLSKLDLGELDQEVTKAQSDYRALHSILTTLCATKEPLNDTEIELLDSIRVINKSLVEGVKKGNVSDLVGVSECLIEQMKSYMLAVSAVAEQRSSERKPEAPDDTRKAFSLKRLFKRPDNNKKQGN